MDVKKLKGAFKSAGKFVMERDDVIQACLLGVLTKMHVFLLGGPGTAKSMSARLILGMITGAKTFQKQLTRQMTEEAVFGPLNFPKLREKGVYEYNLKGGLADCELALLEEYYDASDGCIRSMNELLNEREYSRNVGNIVKCPLHSAIATSNFWRDQKDAQAVADRFLIRVNVKPIQETENIIDMVLGVRNPQIQASIDWQDLKDAHAQVQKVKLDREVAGMYVEMAQEYQKRVGDTVYVSHRRINWTADLLRANAFLKGENTVEIEDLKAAKFGLVFLGDEAQESAFAGAYDAIIKKYEVARELRKKLEVFEVAHSEMEAEIKKGITDTRATELHNEAVILKEGLIAKDRPEGEEVEKGLDALAEKFNSLIVELLKKVSPEDLNSI